MEARVIKDFATPMHRFRVGQLVNESEIDGAVNIMGWIERGYLTPGSVMMPEPEPALEAEFTDEDPAMLEPTDAMEPIEEAWAAAPKKGDAP